MVDASTDAKIREAISIAEYSTYLLEHGERAILTHEQQQEVDWQETSVREWFTRIEDGAVNVLPEGVLPESVLGWAGDHGVVEQAVWDALWSDDAVLALRMLRQILERAMVNNGQAGWLMEPEGRAGKPLSAAEAGMGHTDPANRVQAEAALRDGSGPKKKWWSRS